MQMNAEQVILTRQLPKTGQRDMYSGYDDGVYEAGWWIGKHGGNNKTRFIAKTLEGNDVVIDLATGLTWAADYDKAGGFGGASVTWYAALVFCHELDFAGFTDWRLPNVFELLSIINYANNTPAIYTDFFSFPSDYVCWTSTTSPVNTLKALVVNINGGSCVSRTKTSPTNLLCCRGGL